MSQNYLPIAKPKNLTRRGLLKKGAVTLIGLTAMLQGSTRLLNAEESTEMTIVTLVNVLKSTQNSVCDAAAARLMALHDNSSNYDLHLRSANLSSAQIERIAEALQAVHRQGGPALHSFSLSYNSNLNDEGMLTLVKTLPPTVTEVGLVQCGLGDVGGAALLAWASGATKLQMLCVEQNAFSNVTKDRLVKLGREKPGLLVVV